MWMLFASFAFALMGTCVKLASTRYSIAEIVLVRGLVGVALLFFLARIKGRSLATPEPLAHLWRGLLGVASLWLWFAAIARLPLATAVTLNYLSPIWTAVALIVAALWRGERRFPWALLAAILASFGGVVLVLRPAFAANQWLGGLMALASGALAALAYLMVRRLSRKGEPEYRVVFYFSLLNVVAGLAGTLAFPSSGSHAPDWRGALLLLGGPDRYRRPAGPDPRLPPGPHPGGGQPAVQRHRLFQPAGRLDLGRRFPLDGLGRHRRHPRLLHCGQRDRAPHCGARRAGASCCIVYPGFIIVGK
ncbi:DMT family transporter [Massilia sp. Dwa41.01b]|nr:DMT family transporter [Massilia sp. Dwa41.01b]